MGDKGSQDDGHYHQRGGYQKTFAETQMTSWQPFYRSLQIKMGSLVLK